MPKRKMFDLSRRINRTTFVVGFLASFAFGAGLSGLLDILAKISATLGAIGGLVLILIMIALLVYWVCLMRQRANDINDRYALVIFILAWLTPGFLLLALMPGQREATRYGTPPQRGLDLR